MLIRPARRVRGILRVPGDKSISHRAAILSALAEGAAHLTNFSTSEDCASTLACLDQLGVSIERAEESLRIEGVGLRGLSAARSALDCRNSGSTMRMLAGVLAGQDFVSEMTGDDSLRARPMKRIIEPLELMGARISSNTGRAPLRINGLAPLNSITYEMPVASAQVKSCIMLAGMLARGRTQIIEKGGPTRDHTERLLRWLGVNVEETVRLEDDGTPSKIFALEGLESFAAREIKIPGDISSASFFAAAAALLAGSDLVIEDVGLNPTRAQIIETLRRLGFDVETDAPLDVCNEPVGNIRIKGSAGPTRPADESARALRGALIPQLIDELPVLAVVGTQVEGGLEIRDAAELRVKETDRIAATAANLRAMGARVEEYEDGLAVDGPTALRGARLSAYGDHRIAMACAVAALIAEGESEIDGAECVNVSFPEFFRLLETVIER